MMEKIDMDYKRPKNLKNLIQILQDEQFVR